MISNILRDFVDRIIDGKAITEADLHQLQRVILADGVSNRETVDVLAALDRAIPQKCEGWNAYLVAATVEYAVWTARPTGIIEKDAANWLVTSLSAGEGPTANAMQIAFEIVREAERCDEMLVSFAMRRGNGVSTRKMSREHPATLIG
jgi:hypothetical protein